MESRYIGCPGCGETNIIPGSAVSIDCADCGREIVHPEIEEVSDLDEGPEWDEDPLTVEETEADRWDRMSALDEGYYGRCEIDDDRLDTFRNEY